jgi:hypothetical protein
MIAQINSPWTMEQAAALMEWQLCNYVHPFTCPNRHDHPILFGDKGVLIPTVRGWVCQFCDYKQDWAHDFMFEPPPPNPLMALTNPTADE